MGKDYCSIKECHNTAGCVGRFGKIVRLHHLPKEKSLRSAWVRAISRKKAIIVVRGLASAQIISQKYLEAHGTDA
jgi:hypothetical protein